jgi:hypothetical protein
MSEVGKIAALRNVDGQQIQVLLAAMAAEWRAEGAHVAGVVAELHGLPDRTCSAGFLRDVAFDKAHSIYLDTPASPTSCHLDVAGVAAAGAALLGQIPESDLVILNKFGKLEAMGQGLAAAFRCAVDAGKPLLTTVSAAHSEAWRAFAPQAIFLESDKTALRN